MPGQLTLAALDAASADLQEVCIGQDKKEKKQKDAKDLAVIYGIWRGMDAVFFLGVFLSSMWFKMSNRSNQRRS